MPQKRRATRRGGRKQGRVLQWLKKALPRINAFARKHKLVSRAGNLAIRSGQVPAQYLPGLTAGVGVDKKLGYGRRGMRLAGGGLRLAGSRVY